MLWLAAYLTGFPPVGLHALCWTHGLARPARPVGTEVDRGLIPAAPMCVYPCFISTSDTPE